MSISPISQAVVKNLPASAGDASDVGLIPGSGRSPRVGNGNPFQYSCLENSMDRGVWQATVQGVSKIRTRLSARVHTHTHTRVRGLGCTLRLTIYEAHFNCKDSSTKAAAPPTPSHHSIARWSIEMIFMNVFW